MQLASTIAPRLRPPPLWFVTNGDITVGPVTTNLLVRGVLHERVPTECLVRQRSWSAWRNVERIREVAALRRAQAREGAVLIEKTRWTEGAPRGALTQLARDLVTARDPGAVLLHCLLEAMQTTGACVGAVHRRRTAEPALVTTCVSGPAMDQRLGQTVRLDDPALTLAAQGISLCEIPGTTTPSEYVRNRLGAFPACSGIAMVPVLCSGRLYAVIELGRPDHGFREADFQRILAIADQAAAHLGVVRNRQ